jgi:hypothetical protein
MIDNTKSINFGRSLDHITIDQTNVIGLIGSMFDQIFNRVKFD